MKIAITSDSVIDLPQDLLNEYDIKVIPLNIMLGENEYKDNQITWCRKPRHDLWCFGDRLV